PIGARGQGREITILRASHCGEDSQFPALGPVRATPAHAWRTGLASASPFLASASGFQNDLDAMACESPATLAYWFCALANLELTVRRAFRSRPSPLVPRPPLVLLSYAAKSLQSLFWVRVTNHP